ncbi:hypothetical protein ACFLZW_01970 [Chloroflexota bacterium]
MLVHEPTIRTAAGEIRCSARLEMDKPLPNLPQELWYRFPEKYAADISTRAEAFAPTALLVAMYAAEDLVIRGPISPLLAYNLFEYRNIYHSWRPKIFKMVDIQYDCLEKAPASVQPAAAATAFSGGVDSFYTLWAHLPGNQPIPQARVTHGLFVHGLDLRLDDPNNFQAAAIHYQALFEDMGLELILASTNAYQFSEFRINWTLFDGPPLVGAASLLSPLLGRFYIPSGMPSYLKLIPQGSSPLTDHLLSTETLDIIHHGASISRYEKTLAVVNWPVTYNSLRVCSDKQKMFGLKNCAVCQKCYRTMTLLEILDVFENYSENFPTGLSIGSYLRWGLLTHLDPDQAGAIRKNALESGRFGMAFFVQVAILLRIIKRFLVESFKIILGRQAIYRLKRKVYPPESGINGREQ